MYSHVLQYKTIYKLCIPTFNNIKQLQTMYSSNVLQYITILQSMQLNILEYETIKDYVFLCFRI